MELQADIEAIGLGGFAKVYRGMMTGLAVEKVVAVKVPHIFSMMPEYLRERKVWCDIEVTFASLAEKLL